MMMLRSTYACTWYVQVSTSEQYSNSIPRPQSYMTKQFNTPVRSVLFLCHLPYVMSCCTARGPRHVVVVFFFLNKETTTTTSDH